MNQQAIYQGTLSHHRYLPLEHSFTYPITMLLSPLSYLAASRSSWLWSSNNRALVSLSSRDFADGQGDWFYVENYIRNIVQEKLGRDFTGYISLLTMPRFLGRGFNPASFYYCYTNDNVLIAVVTEVTNTPWGERDYYTALVPEEGLIASSDAKKLFVSPLMVMEQTYQWQLTRPDKTIHIRIETYEKQNKIFSANLHLSFRPWDEKALGKISWRFIGTLKVLPLIYLQALVLRLKGVKWQRHSRH